VKKKHIKILLAVMMVWSELKTPGRLTAVLASLFQF